MLTSEEILEKAEYGKYKNTPGEHYFNICAMCGYLEHIHSDNGSVIAPIGRVIVSTNNLHNYKDMPFVCSECKNVERRFPDIFEWMQKVLTAHLKRHHE
jgi:hypothetical protein